MHCFNGIATWLDAALIKYINRHLLYIALTAPQRCLTRHHSVPIAVIPSLLVDCFNGIATFFDAAPSDFCTGLLHLFLRPPSLSLICSFFISLPWWWPSFRVGLILTPAYRDQRTLGVRRRPGAGSYVLVTGNNQPERARSIQSREQHTDAHVRAI